MQIANNNIVARVAAVVAGLGLVASSFVAFAPAANAQTSSDLQAQIAALMAQIAALQAQAGGSASVNASFNRDLTIGSTGADVTALQNWLASKGFAIAAGATGYFGGQTQAALAKYQASVGISPAAGYFGPITRAKVNASAGGSTGGNTGGNTGGSTDDDLQGGAGSIDSYQLISSINNEEVGEDEEDVEVMGLEIEADDGSDLKFTAVRLVFDENTAATASDFDEYASEVSIWFDGEEVGRVDADEFTDDNDWTKTVSLDGAILEAGETGELTVAVSGASSIDSGDLTDPWDLGITQVRFVDADGATISETPSTSATVRIFTFASFATASDVEFKIASDDDDINDARTIEVDATDDTDNVDVLSFTLEGEGDSDLEIKNFAVSVTVTGAGNTDDVLAGLALWIDGEEVATADTVSTGGSTEDYLFDDVDYVIDAGDTVEAVIKADFISIADALDEGDTVAFSISEDITDQATRVDVEDESGERLADADITGTVTSGAFELRSVGVMVTFISATETVSSNDSADDDVGTFVIKYNVEAFGGDVYVDNSAAPTIAATIPDTTITTDGIRYLLDEAGTATVDHVDDVVTFTTSGGATDSTDNVYLQDGDDSDFTLTVVRTNPGTATNALADGIFHVKLKAIGWASTDTTTYNVYDFNLEDFKTDPVSVN